VIYRNMVTVMALLMVLLGLAMIAITLTRGFGVGLLLGALFVAAGVARLWLLHGRAR
jgi:hypothetical protein